ncbi:uncharacterized protein LOC135121505 [Zophobas morio]|uniref:uncharacterized protein LOC135121505 n=1 Tax=Zophobas morio TaxID=2755281 RepID=UPI0030834B9F
MTETAEDSLLEYATFNYDDFNISGVQDYLSDYEDINQALHRQQQILKKVKECLANTFEIINYKALKYTSENSVKTDIISVEKEDLSASDTQTVASLRSTLSTHSKATFLSTDNALDASVVPDNSSSKFPNSQKNFSRIRKPSKLSAVLSDSKLTTNFLENKYNTYENSLIKYNK